MRISDWSSDVCSSDLLERFVTPTGSNYDLIALGRIRSLRNLFTGVLGKGQRRKSTPGKSSNCATRQKVVIIVHKFRSEERREGKEGVSKCRSRWSPDHTHKNEEW